MARPQKNTVDYFPFYCEEGQKMFYLEETYGNDGFATFVKILRELARVDYHYLDLSKKSSLMFLSAKCKVSIETLESIISDLVMLEKFDELLWNENKIIWCQSFIDSIQDAYIKRSNKCITYNSLLLHLESLGVRKPLKSSSKPLKSSSEGGENTQTKLKKTKEEENKEEQTPPTPKGEYFDFDVYLQKINELFGRDFKVVNDVTKRKMKATLKTYTKHNVWIAMQNCKNDTHHIESNYKYCTPEFFARTTTIERHGDKLREKSNGSNTYQLID
jgi:hypothetical protein